jgi:hypothetical protein
VLRLAPRSRWYQSGINIVRHPSEQEGVACRHLLELGLLPRIAHASQGPARVLHHAVLRHELRGDHSSHRYLSIVCWVVVIREEHRATASNPTGSSIRLRKKLLGPGNYIERWAASTARGVPASLLPGCDESSEEENEQCEHKPGKQSVVGPGHIRQCKAGVHARSSKVQVDMDVP